MSADEYTPTTDQVREWASDDGGLAEYHDPINGHRQAVWARRAFDRWLTAHDAEIRAELPELMPLDDGDWLYQGVRHNGEQIIEQYWKRATRVSNIDMLLAEIQAMHREKHGSNDHGDYVICDYDKTAWPCQTELILQKAASKDINS